MQFGISVNQTELPFGTRFNLSDGDLSVDWCYKVQNLAICAASNNSGCNQTLRELLTNDTAYSNFIPFVPESLFVGALSSWMAGVTNATDFQNYLKAEKNPLEIVRSGLKLYSSYDPACPDFYAIGQNSGAAKQNMIRVGSAPLPSLLCLSVAAIWTVRLL
jgi:hypothetical protein